VSTKVEVDALPPCDICTSLDGKDGVKAEPAVIDGRTVHGPWANMCPTHWRLVGVGRLGTGFGQRLVVRGTE
jgi:hypothetical protein